ncbi:MAG: DUF697 domain-containing protein [Deltaproteobacteria bacterium]|jgi:uncharacterized protein (DUF697 family)|nr:DUF697 domain-containing protein [Deltaproteobacteria bacterium]
MSLDNSREIIEVEAQEVNSRDLPDQNKIDALIRNRVYASMAVGFVPLPLADIGGLTAIQAEMVYRLSRAYGLPFSLEWGRKAIACILGALAPVALAPNIGSLLRNIPVIGLGLRGASSSLTFGAVTYTIGRIFARRFASGKPLAQEDLKGMSEEIKDGLEKGKMKVKSWVNGSSSARTDTFEGSPA